MFKPDQPIKSFREDILGRAPFAISLGETILSYRYKESIVIGLFGEWGAGKTSTINIILETITHKTAKRRKNKPVIVFFNPWIFSGQGNLVFQFFNQLAASLREQGQSEETADLSDKLLQYASCVLQSQTPADQQNVNLHALRCQIEARFNSLKRKIIIIIDDVDRLNNQEICQVFQMLKMMANFPQTMYLLSMDKHVVVNALEKVYEGAGLEYLEKMVQVPFEIPSATGQVIEQTILTRMNELIHEMSESKVEAMYWGNLFHGGLKYFFTTIRDINRYVNALRFSVPMIRSELNIVDFFAITAIQLFAPEVYFSIRDNKALFTGIIDPGSPVPDQEREQCLEIITKAPDEFGNPLQNILERIFPRLETLFENVSYDKPWLTTWREEGRICSPEVFESFFKLALPEGSLTRNEIEIILARADSRSVFTGILENLIEEEKINTFLARLEDRAPRIPIRSIENIVTSLIDTGDRFPEQDFDENGITSHSRLINLTISLCRRLKTQDARFKLLKESLHNTRRSLLSIVKVVDALDKELTQAQENDMGFTEISTTINLGQLIELKQVVLEKIETWAVNGELARHQNLAPIIINWVKWGEIKKAASFTGDMLGSDTGLLDFITAFYRKTSVEGAFDLSFKIEKKTNLCLIRQLTDVEKIEKRLRVISSYPGFKKLDRHKRGAVLEFLELVKSSSAR